VPTETVYGLICDWGSSTARERIYSLKKRREDKPLAMFVPSLASLSELGIKLPPMAFALGKTFCPGPITIVTPGVDGETIGFRIPEHPFILKLLQHFGGPLASTSANRSGEPATLCVEDALASLEGCPDIVIDDGRLGSASQASTVVFCDASTYRIIRHGPISEAQIRNVIEKTQEHDFS